MSSPSQSMLVDLPPIHYDITDVFDDDLFYGELDDQLDDLRTATPLRDADGVSHFVVAAGDGNLGVVPAYKRPDTLSFAFGAETDTTDTDTDFDASTCSRSPGSIPASAYTQRYGPAHDLDAVSYNNDYTSSSTSESDIELLTDHDSGMESDGMFFLGSGDANDTYVGEGETVAVAGTLPRELGLPSGSYAEDPALFFNDGRYAPHNAMSSDSASMLQVGPSFLSYASIIHRSFLYYTFFASALARPSFRVHTYCKCASTLVPLPHSLNISPIHVLNRNER